MKALMNKQAIIVLIALVVQFSTLTTANPTLRVKIQEMPDPGIKCGECACVNPCIQQQPPQPPPQPSSLPPPVGYCNPPPSRLVYTAGASPPPPPRFIYATGDPKNLYPIDDPFDLQIYTNATNDSLRHSWGFLLVGCSALLFLVIC
ncbi:hypothetical protein OROHE_019725 [Orobanche hederae]